MLSRRVLLAAATAAAVDLTAGRTGPAASRGDGVSPPALKRLAADRGLSAGAEVVLSDIRLDPSYGALIREQCDEITPGLEFKWGAFQPNPSVFATGPADWLVGWAADGGLRVRGHTLIWHNNIPAWAPQALEDNPWQVFRQRIQGVVSLYRGRVGEWDVVNEAVQPADDRQDGLRSSLFLNFLGPDYIAEAFFLARQCDPDARLYYNDYGVEWATTEHKARRKAIIGVLERALKKGAPIHGFGLQGHLFTHRRIDAAGLAAFLREVAGMGLAIKVTEFDVRDRFPAVLPWRDERSAAVARAFLDTVLAEPAVEGVVAWSLSDRYSWLRGRDPAARPTPYDAALRRKPLWNALAGALSTAPPRNQLRG